MVEIECPFCEQPCRMDAAAFMAEHCTLRCEGCSVEVEVGGLTEPGALALASMWAGLALAYAIPSLPPSSAIIGLAACSYLAAALTARGRVSRRSRLPPRLRDIK